jgi:hypothetical protein
MSIKKDNHSRGIKGRGRATPISERHDTDAQLSTFALLAKPFSGHFVCGFGFIPSRHYAPLLLIPAAMGPKLYLIHVHHE